MKKKMKRTTNYWLILGAFVLVSCDSGLEISADSFYWKDHETFDARAYHIDMQDVPHEVLRILLPDMGWPAESLDYLDEVMWKYYSWQSGRDFTEFVLYNADGCENVIYYLVYKDGKYVSHKDIAYYEDCAEGGTTKEAKIEGDKIQITVSRQDYGAFMEDRSMETCRITTEGKFDCAEPINFFSGMSLWNNLALRETPAKDGKFVARVNMGETFTTSDSSDWSEEDEYVFVELKGGQSGYILNRLVQTKAVPLAIHSDAVIHSRPDELTRTDKTFSRMDIVALVDAKEEYAWLKVKGRTPGDKWFKEGWIKADRGTQNPIDIAVASLVNKALEEKDDAARYSLLTDIYSNPDFEGGYLRNHVGDYLPGM